MTTKTPLPCADCDAFLASLPAETRPHGETLRWFLDDRELAAGRPHQHVTNADRSDLEACLAALDREVTVGKRIHELCGMLTDLAQSYLDDGETMGEWMARAAAAGDTQTGAQIQALVAEVLDLEEHTTRYLGRPPAMLRGSNGEA